MILRPLPNIPVRIMPSPRLRRACIALWIGSAAATVVALTMAAAGCHPTRSPAPTIPTPHPPLPPPVLSTFTREPTVRVRVVADASEARVTASGEIVVYPAPQTGSPGDPPAHAAAFDSPLSIRRHGSGFMLQSTGGQPYQWDVRQFAIESPGGGHLYLNGLAYSGRLVVCATGDAAASPAVTGEPILTLDVVNHLPMESYLPGVLSRELYASWHPGTFWAQAVAARSYAICELRTPRGRHYDVESTEASQAFGGATAHAKAIDAVRQTRGMVLCYQDQVVAGFYSSCCGGAGQDASQIFPAAPSIPPLSGRQRAAWCRNSRYYRWGPIIRGRQELGQRMAAWGQANRLPLGELRDIASVQVSVMNAAGRPTRFNVTDTSGRGWILTPEAFRFACNYAAPHLPPLKPEQTLKSSHVMPEVSGDQVVFSDGRGFGHGVGLCQYGAEGMTQAGIDPRIVLGYYYPESELRRLY